MRTLIISILFLSMIGCSTDPNAAVQNLLGVEQSKVEKLQEQIDNHVCKVCPECPKCPEEPTTFWTTLETDLPPGRIIEKRCVKGDNNDNYLKIIKNDHETVIVRDIDEDLYTSVHKGDVIKDNSY